MENFDLTKLTESELRELSTKISKEIIARKNITRNEKAKAIIQAIENYMAEFGDLVINVENDIFYLSDGAEFDFVPEDNMIIIT